MIKGNESDVRNIDFELQAKRGDVLHRSELQRIVHISNQMSSLDGVWI